MRPTDSEGEDFCWPDMLREIIYSTVAVVSFYLLPLLCFDVNDRDIFHLLDCFKSMCTLSLSTFLDDDGGDAPSSSFPFRLETKSLQEGYSSVMPEALLSNMDFGAWVSALASTCAVEVVVLAEASELVALQLVEILLDIAVWDGAVDRVVLGKVIKRAQSCDKTWVGDSDTTGNCVRATVSLVLRLVQAT